MTLILLCDYTSRVMKTTDIIQAIASIPNGCFVVITTMRKLTLKGGGEAYKRGGFLVHNNSTYANRKVVTEAIERGDRGEVETPAWAESIAIDGVTITVHKKTLEQYVPLNVSRILKSVYYNAQGKAVSPDSLPLYAKDKPRVVPTKQEREKKGQELFIRPKVATIESIGEPIAEFDKVELEKQIALV